MAMDGTKIHQAAVVFEGPQGKLREAIVIILEWIVQWRKVLQAPSLLLQRPQHVTGDLMKHERHQFLLRA